MDRESVKLNLRHKLSEILTTQEIIVLGYLYALNKHGIQMTNKELADYWNVTPSRVVQINKNLVQKLQRRSVLKLLKDYVSNC